MSMENNAHANYYWDRNEHNIYFELRCFVNFISCRVMLELSIWCVTVQQENKSNQTEWK